MKTDGNLYIYIMIMAITTYMVRALPMTIIRGEIKNPFIKSFLHYMPYATIAAMILPEALFCTSSVYSAIVGLGVAFYFSYVEKDLVAIALFACVSVYFADMILSIG